MAASVYELIEKLLDEGKIGIWTCDCCGKEFIELNRHNHGSDWEEIAKDFSDENGCCTIEGLYGLPGYTLFATDLPNAAGWKILRSIYHILYPSGYHETGICSSICQAKLIKKAIARLVRLDDDEKLCEFFCSLGIKDQDTYQACLKIGLTNRQQKSFEKAMNRLFIKYLQSF